MTTIKQPAPRELSAEELQKAGGGAPSGTLIPMRKIKHNI